MPLIFLLTGVSSFPDPGDWDPVNNKVECLGSGYQGGINYLGPELADAPVQLTGNDPGGGGGGGGYGVKNGSNPVFPVNVHIAPASVYAASGGDSPNATFWNDAGGANNHEVWGAPGTGGQTGGGGGGGVGKTYAGGTGGNGSGTGGTSAAGGGGAAGPHGAGAAGATGGAGGAGDGGTTPPSGVAGTQWDASHGCGSGGAGSAAIGAPGGAGGLYGAGGGGQFGDSTQPVGAGQNGLLVITYTSLLPSPALNYAIIMS
jgi:hypothetical protein